MKEEWEIKKNEAIAVIKAKMRINARLYEDGEYTYEELHAVQNDCMRQLKEIESITDFVNGNKYEELKEKYKYKENNRNL